VPFAKDMFKDVIEVREVDEQLACLFNKVMIECWNGLLLDGRDGSWAQCLKQKKRKRKRCINSNFKISKVPNFWLEKSISHLRSMFLNFSSNKKSEISKNWAQKRHFISRTCMSLFIQLNYTKRNSDLKTTVLQGEGNQES